MDGTKGKVLKKEKDVVLPGDVIVDSMDYLPGKNCYREGSTIVSKRIGLVYFKNRVIEVVPLAGMYMPEPGDMVIGVVKDVQRNGWVVDINSPYEAFLPLSGVREFIDPVKTDMTKIYAIGDVIYGKITTVTPLKAIYMSMQDPKARKFTEGRIVKISPVKVPRLIGKRGSMINLVKTKTRCRISVGQNGVIWLQGENESLAVKAIKVVERRSHTDGLTDYVEKLLSENR